MRLKIELPYRCTPDRGLPHCRVAQLVRYGDNDHREKQGGVNMGDQRALAASAAGSLSGLGVSCVHLAVLRLKLGYRNTAILSVSDRYARWREPTSFRSRTNVLGRSCRPISKLSQVS